MVVAFVGFVGGWAKELFGPDVLPLAGAAGAGIATPNRSGMLIGAWEPNALPRPAIMSLTGLFCWAPSAPGPTAGS